jgi:hypothetical protein
MLSQNAGKHLISVLYEWLFLLLMSTEENCFVPKRSHSVLVQFIIIKESLAEPSLDSSISYISAAFPIQSGNGNVGIQNKHRPITHFPYKTFRIQRSDTATWHSIRLSSTQLMFKSSNSIFFLASYPPSLSFPLFLFCMFSIIMQIVCSWSLQKTTLQM